MALRLQATGRQKCQYTHRVNAHPTCNLNAPWPLRQGYAQHIPTSWFPTVTIVGVVAAGAHPACAHETVLDLLVLEGQQPLVKKEKGVVRVADVPDDPDESSIGGVSLYQHHGERG